MNETVSSSKELAPGGRRRNEGGIEFCRSSFPSAYVSINLDTLCGEKISRSVSEYEHAIVEACHYIQRHYLPVRVCGPLSNVISMEFSKVNTSWERGGGSKGEAFLSYRELTPKLHKRLRPSRPDSPRPGFRCES